MEKTNFKFRLYVASRTPVTEEKIHALEAGLKRTFNGTCVFEVIDILENPHLAGEDRVIATPTFIKLQPEPAQRIIGEFGDANKVLAVLGLIDA